MTHTQEYIDALLAQRDELIDEVRRLTENNHDLTQNAQRLESANESLKAQENATRNYRVQNAAIPIMASLMQALYQNVVAEQGPWRNKQSPLEGDELASLARVACEAAEKLLTEIDERAILKDD